MAGFVDLFRFALGWWSSPTTTPEPSPDEAICYEVIVRPSLASRLLARPSIAGDVVTRPSMASGLVVREELAGEVIVRPLISGVAGHFCRCEEP